MNTDFEFRNAFTPLSEIDELLDDGFTIERGYAILNWGGYPYHIKLTRIKTPENLLWWIAHLAEKEWKGMTPFAIREFIISVAVHNDFPMFQD